jgi:hypothetical protein
MNLIKIKQSVFLAFVVVFIIIGLGFYLYYRNTMGNLVLKSSAFKAGEFIPQKFTCDGENINPFLEIRNIPPEAKSLVLIMDDPDAPAGTWDHWLLWNIDPKTQYIPEDSVPPGARLGKNSFGRLNYGGPCPPRGSNPHRYMFKIYALDVVLELPEGASKQELLKAMEGHILDEEALIGLYAR